MIEEKSHPRHDSFLPAPFIASLHRRRPHAIIDGSRCGKKNALRTIARA
jgi:hypothetical protein